MHTIRRTTFIDAPVDRCFLLALRVDLRIEHPSGTKAEAPYGTSLAGQLVTWSRKDAGGFEHTTRIDRYRPYSYFRDVAADQRFSLFEHEHHFASFDGGTRLRDDLRFVAPAGLLQSFAERKLRRRLETFLAERNSRIRKIAESDQWHRYLELDIPTPPEAPDEPSRQTRSLIPAKI